MILMMMINQALNASSLSWYSPKAVCSGVETISPPDKTITAGITENTAITTDEKNDIHPANRGLKKGTANRAHTTPTSGKSKFSGIYFLFIQRKSKPKKPL